MALAVAGCNHNRIHAAHAIGFPTRKARPTKAKDRHLDIDSDLPMCAGRSQRTLSSGAWNTGLVVP